MSGFRDEQIEPSYHPYWLASNEYADPHHGLHYLLAIDLCYRHWSW